MGIRKPLNTDHKFDLQDSSSLCHHLFWCISMLLPEKKKRRNTSQFFSGKRRFFQLEEPRSGAGIVAITGKGGYCKLNLCCLPEKGPSLHPYRPCLAPDEDSGACARLARSDVAQGFFLRVGSKICWWPTTKKWYEWTLHKENGSQQWSKLKATKQMFLTPLKINMEPENQPLEKEIPVRNHHFQVPC